ncbi:MAG TPA: hypothetical protein PKN48_00405 [Bacteroidales bacterium]|nr:hypothetical protein [Bacteroidales bacterium]
MKSFSLICITLLSAALVAGSIFHVIKLHKINQEVMHLQNQMAQVDTVIVIDSVSVKKLTLLVDKIRLENSMLNEKYLKKSKQLISYNKVIIALQDSIKKLSTVDSSSVDSSGAMSTVREFKVEKEPFYIEGVFMKEPPWFISFNTLSAKLALEIIATENKAGFWETYVTTSSGNIKIASLDTRYKKYNTSTSKYLLGSQVTSLGRDISGQIFAGYNKTAVGVGYGTTGASLSIMYFFLR